MIKHVVMWSFADHATPDERRTAMAELNAFADVYPQVRGWSFGENVSERDHTYQYAFVAEFDTRDDLTTYMEDPGHREFVQLRWRHLIARQAIVSLDVD